jgi:hypothetical protein
MPVFSFLTKIKIQLENLGINRSNVQWFWYSLKDSIQARKTQSKHSQKTADLRKQYAIGPIADYGKNWNALRNLNLRLDLSVFSSSKSYTLSRDLLSPCKFASYALNIDWKEKDSWNFTISEIMVVYIGRNRSKRLIISTIYKIVCFSRI